ncbi:MAG TPA: hypothetical protein GX391_08300 [Firmicutes bacterium]|jgi:ribosome biogenesis GTPase A|nr:hypothetical protein [Bacillota bacterium]HOQ23088.1 50S ribosome-binding GTPase [Bacillota bacterium]HPT66985.1 50S ribosome-binding GTPase [Bacillota bacterium]
MKKTHCPGCGAPFQATDPGAPGFLPPEAQERPDAICRRCYRLKHYGQLESAGRSSVKIERVIRQAMAGIDLAVLVADVFDLEGSFATGWVELIKAPVLVALNKIDLLPAKTPVDEVATIAEKIWAKRLPDLGLRGVIPVSAKKSRGLTRLREEIVLNRGKHHRIGFFGVTNVGKSSLLTRFLGEDAVRPTVSSAPGTTQGVTHWYDQQRDMTFYDTPGWAPGSRLTDLVCPECAGRLVVKERVHSKFLQLSPGGVLMLGPYAMLTLASGDSCNFSVYPAENIALHVTNPVKAGELLANSPGWLGSICDGCKKNLAWQEQDFTVPAGCDLYLSGLGWLTPRSTAAKMKLRWPAGVEAGVRQPNLFGRK